MTLLPPLATTNRYKRNFSLGVCGASVLTAILEFILGSSAAIFHHLYYMGGILCILSAFGGLSGCISRRAAGLIWSLMFACTTAYGFIVIGGISVFFVGHVASEIDSLTEIKYSNVQLKHESIEEEYTNSQVLLITSSVFLLLMGILAGMQTRSMHQAVGDKRGSVAMLQTFSICAIPISLLLVLGGHFIVDTQTLASAPYTGIFMFICGMFSMVLALFAFIGSAFEYRRLLGLFGWMAFFLAIGLMTSSVASIFMGDKVRHHIISNWESIRIVLPPTIQAKYDRSQFISLVEANLKSFAFVGVATGWLLLIQSSAATTLKNIIHSSKLQLAEDKAFTKNLKEIHGITDDDDFNPEEHSSHPHFALRRQWHLHFKSHRRKHRIAMRIGCALCSIVLVLLLVLMTTSVIFASKCGNISKADNAATFALSEPETTNKNVEFDFTSYYTIGILKLTQGNQTDGSITVEEYALQEEYATSVQTYETINDTVMFLLGPVSTPRILWVDLSCQEARVTTILPMATKPKVLNLYSEAMMDLNLRDYEGNSALVHFLNTTTTQGNINLYGAYVGSGGMISTTTSGEIEVVESFFDASGASSHAIATLTSDYGGLRLLNTTLTDTVLTMTTQVGQIVLSEVLSVPTHGWSSIELESDSGGIYASEVAANWIHMKTNEGKIEGYGVTAAEGNFRVGRFTAESKSGNIELYDVSAGGYIHVETHTGDISIHLKSYSFRGLFSIRSETGIISVRKGEYSFDTFVDFNSTNSKEVTGSINCADGETNCYYVGDIHVISHSGDIELIIGCEDTQCG